MSSAAPPPRTLPGCNVRPPQRCRGSAGQTVGRPRAKQSAAVGIAQRAVGGGSAHLFRPKLAPKAELEDVVVGTLLVGHQPALDRALLPGDSAASARGGRRRPTPSLVKPAFCVVTPIDTIGAMSWTW
eukprot:694006-Prymnesium_polylepis.1